MQNWNSESETLHNLKVSHEEATPVYGNTHVSSILIMDGWNWTQKPMQGKWKFLVSPLYQQRRAVMILNGLFDMSLSSGMVSWKSLPLVDAFWPKELLSSTALNFPFTHSHLFLKWEANILLKTMKSFSWYTQPNCLISLLRWRKRQIQRWRYFTRTWNKISNAFFMVTLSACGTFLVKDATAAAD